MVGTGQPLGMHVGALLLKFPRLHVIDDKLPKGVYPALHVILQDAPLAKVPVQLPVPPFGIVGVEHPLALHTGTVLKIPRLHVIDDKFPKGVYPALHVILQEAPLAKVPAQLTLPPFGIVGVAHPLALHTGAVV